MLDEAKDRLLGQLSRGEPGGPRAGPSDTSTGGTIGRRRFLRGAGGAAVALGGVRTADNVVLGYGRVTGTNLTRQDPEAVAADGLLAGRRTTRALGHSFGYERGRLTVSAGGETRATVSIDGTTPAAAAGLDEELGLADSGAAGPVERTVRDLAAARAGRVRFAFEPYPAFFDRVRAAEARLITTGLLRGGSRGVSPELIAAFTGADPTDPRAVLEGLRGAFREEATYDVPRYVAGGIYFNLLFGTVDVREPFRSPVDFESLRESPGETGMFCFELTRRSIEALHAVDAAAQRTPVAAAPARDPRHRHVYTAVASAVREAGALAVPVTFVDYTPTTLYDDAGLGDRLGDGLNAFNTAHRAATIRWNH